MVPATAALFFAPLFPPRELFSCSSARGGGGGPWTRGCVLVLGRVLVLARGGSVVVVVVVVVGAVLLLTGAPDKGIPPGSWRTRGVGVVGGGVMGFGRLVTSSVEGVCVAFAGRLITVG